MDKSYLEINNSNTYSIEIFPTKTDMDFASQIALVKEYESLGVKSVNVTCSPGKMDFTKALVRKLRQETNMVIIPHIVASLLTRKDLDCALQEYTDLGIRNILVIRGDESKDFDYTNYSPEFEYAKDLVKQIKSQTADFNIGVAGFPEQHYLEPNFILEIQHLYEKVEAGADYIVTQLFFDNRDFDDFIERCKLFDISVPIIPGVTYIKDKTHAHFIAKMALGSRIPSKLLGKVYKDVPNCGVEWLKSQISDLLQSETSKLIHLYTFNTYKPFSDIIENI